MNTYLVAIKGTHFQRNVVAANPDEALFLASQRFAVTKADMEIRRVIPTASNPQRDELRQDVPAQVPASVRPAAGT